MPDAPPAPDLAPHDVLTFDELRARLGMSRNGLRELLDRGAGPPVLRTVWRSAIWSRLDVDLWQLDELRRGYAYDPDAEFTGPRFRAPLQVRAPA